MKKQVSRGLPWLIVAGFGLIMTLQFILPEAPYSARSKAYAGFLNYSTGYRADSIGADTVIATAWALREKDTTDVLPCVGYSKARLWVGASSDTYKVYIQTSFDGTTWTQKDSAAVAKATETFSIAYDSTYRMPNTGNLGTPAPYFRVIFLQNETGHCGSGTAKPTTHCAKIKGMLVRLLVWD